MSNPSKASATTLNTQANLVSPDDFYQALIDAHRDLDEAQSHALNAKLILLLANHVGQPSVLAQALQAARASTLGASKLPQPSDPSPAPTQHAPKT